MVVGHWTDNHLLRTYIYSFHMPALFIISGFLFKPHVWYKTLVAFFFPILFFSIINIAIQLLLGNTSFNSLHFPRIIFSLLHNSGFFMGTWFIWALLGLRFLFGDLRLLAIFRKHYVLITVMCIIISIFEKQYSGIDTVSLGCHIGKMIPSMVFFCMGFFLKDVKWDPNSLSTTQIIIMLISFIILPIINGYVSLGDYNYGRSYLLFIVNAIISSVLILALSAEIPQSKYIITISKGTLVVLGTHMSILQILNHLLPDSLSLLFPFITMIVCYYIIVLCERYCPILLGKWRNISFVKRDLKKRSALKQPLHQNI
mgnify:FL=1